MNQSDKAIIETLITDIEDGNITSWSEFMVRVTLNGLTIDHNPLILLLKHGHNRFVYDFVYETALNSRAADRYITDDFLTHVVQCTSMFWIRREGHDIVQILNPRVWLMRIFHRLPAVVLKYLLSLEDEKNRHILDNLTYRNRNHLVDVIFIVKKECLETQRKTHSEKLMLICTRLDKLYRDLTTTTVSFN